MKITVLGCRGSIPVSGKEFVKYGGNTSCYVVETEGRLICVDAGSGLPLLAELAPDCRRISLLLTHLHLDHIMGIPMCSLFFRPDFEMDIYVPEAGDVQALEDAFSPPYWPVRPSRLPCRVTYHVLEDSFSIGDVKVASMQGNHPGGCRILRLEGDGKKAVFASDNTLTPDQEPALRDFCRGADLFFPDGMYTREEWPGQENFGHSCMEDAAAFGSSLGVRTFITHHDPLRTDADLDRISLPEGCSFAYQGEVLDLGTTDRAMEPDLGKNDRAIKLDLDEKQSQLFVSTCLQLSTEKDKEELLSRILDAAMEVACCDAGTLYLLEDDGLHFSRMVTRSMGVRQGGHGSPITLPPVPLKESFVSAWAVLHEKNVNVADIRRDSRFDFSGSVRYDDMTGYRTGSLLVVPLFDDRQKCLGCMQLINALPGENLPVDTFIPFDAQTEILVSAMASQAAVSLTNMHYAEQIQQLLESLIGAFSEAVDARTPYNANHTRNMVRYARTFLDRHRATGSYWDFDDEHRRAFVYAVWLHDVGKLATPLNIMNKENRLGDRWELVAARMERAQLLAEVASLKGDLSEEDARKEMQWLSDAKAHLKKIDGAGFLPDSELAFVEELAGHSYVDMDGQEKLLLTPEEHARLQVRKGTLTPQERSIMESHVVYTAKILDQVTFPEAYAKVPVWASMHHEFLNGKGYPNHVTGEFISKEVRLLTIIDVFDALTAADRPYKPAVPLEKALSVLKEMVEEGSLDGSILEDFISCRPWEEDQAS